MAKTLLIVAAVLSLLMAPLVLSEVQGEDPPPPSEDRQQELEKMLGELQLPSFGPNQRSIRIAPDVRGMNRSWTCAAQAGSPEAQSVCDFGRELSRMAPCTRPEDCQALDLWNRRVEPPGLRHARPLDGARGLGVIPVGQLFVETKPDTEAKPDAETKPDVEDEPRE